MDKDDSRPANMKADETDTDRFHLLLGMSLGAFSLIEKKRFWVYKRYCYFENYTLPATTPKGFSKHSFGRNAAKCKYIFGKCFFDFFYIFFDK